MASYNRVVLVGNLTRDVKLDHTPQGTAVTEIGMAVNDRVKRAGEWTDEATFVDITLWGRQAEVAAEYLSKGSSLLVEGRLKLDTWEKDGQKRSKLRVVGERLQLLGGRGGGTSGRQGASGSAQAPQNTQGTQAPQNSTSSAQSSPDSGRSSDSNNSANAGDSFADDEIPF